MIKIKRKFALLIITVILIANHLYKSDLSYSATLATPTNVQVTASVDSPYLNGNVSVTWDKVVGATAYSVKVSRIGTNEYIIDTVNSESNTKSVITNLVGGINYSIQVRTIKTVEYSDWTSSSLTARPTTLPKAPDKPSATVTSGGVNVTWVSLKTNEIGGLSLIHI